MRFSTSVFFSSKVPTLDPDSNPNFCFEFAFEFVELLELKFDSPLHDAAGSQTSNSNNTVNLKPNLNKKLGYDKLTKFYRARPTV